FVGAGGGAGHFTAAAETADLEQGLDPAGRSHAWRGCAASGLPASGGHYRKRMVVPAAGRRSLMRESVPLTRSSDVTNMRHHR
ncbi:hypothetical protein AB1A87_17575, partial [Stenotrophomonas maltophilia]|uniref:hypothetical protein n=1 Tax=Stenotrophomonas maltophilia TaxID=40324 RepID=UPI003453F849